MLAKNWQDLIKPTKLDITASKSNPNQATIIAEPLERGFGHTLGVALRRILLSSLQGAAITSIKIEGVLHEFSSVPGIRGRNRNRSQYQRTAPQKPCYGKEAHDAGC